MNSFQMVALGGIAGVLALEAWGACRVGGRLPLRLARCVIWACAAGAVAQPSLVQQVAAALGIGRGADVVLYFLALAYLGSVFYFLSACHSLQRQVTLLVRHVSLREARRGDGGQAGVDTDLDSGPG